MVEDWVKRISKFEIGEILLTAIDKEGTRKGYDINLVKSVTDLVKVPVIVSGGMGKPEDLIEVVQKGNADAVSMADILHYNRSTLTEIRKIALKNKINLRTFRKKK